MCAIFGIYHPKGEIAIPTFYALLSMQHRGQESSGIAVSDGKKLEVHKDLGLVLQVFHRPQDLPQFNGYPFGLGHNRYGTTGEPKVENAQPMTQETDFGKVALAHNGNIFNAPELKKELLTAGETLSSTSDSEILLKLILKSPDQRIENKIQHASSQLKGAYSFTMIYGKKLIGCRDPLGFWPLCLGEYDGGFVLASEFCALNYIGAKFIRELEHGEILMIDENGLHSEFLNRKKSAFCSFEYYYFAAPGSTFLGRRVENARFKMGEGLWQEYPVDADWVIPIPDTARPAAEGLSYASGIPLRSALVKNRWLWRTFIEPDQRLREIAAGLKYSPLREVIEGKRVIVVDDSIVRGTTTGKIINLIREIARPKEVHLRITAPPIKYPCFFGIDTASRKELIAANLTVEEIRKKLGADSLGYLSLPSGIKAIDKALREKLCVACFTGDYPLPVPSVRDKLALAS